MIDSAERVDAAMQQSGTDRAFERSILLLHIAASCPRDAAELSRRIARPQHSVHEELTQLIHEGVVHIHDGSLRTSAAARILAEATPDELREIHDRVLAEQESASTMRSVVLVALADSGCRDEALLHLLIRTIGEHPEDTAAIGALASVARARGCTEEELRLLQAADASGRGRADEVLSLTDGLLTAASPSIAARAGILAAGAHIQTNRLDRATAIYRHIGAERVHHEGVWGVVAAIGQGDIATAEHWRSAMGSVSLTSLAAGLTDLADGLIDSVRGNGDGALDVLARAVSTLAPVGSAAVLPESPAALAALVALGRGEPATAEMLLSRGLRAQLGGRAGRRRHLILTSWAQMVQGKMDAAEKTLTLLDSTRDLGDRDQLLYWTLRAGIARRRADDASMKSAWQEVRGRTFGMSVTLYDTVTLGEMMLVAARLRDSDRVSDAVQQAMTLLDALGSPISWAAPLHWHGVQAAFQSEDPAALIPHANALGKAGRTSAYAATLAKAGNTWLEVLRGETDFASVEASARALASKGLVWDAARLAGQAALQHPERDGALSMMQLAREITKGQLDKAPSAQASLLTNRELEVGRLVLDGEGYRAIGERLFISPKTVEHHVARIRTRLGATNRGELLERLHDVVSELDR